MIRLTDECLVCGGTHAIGLPCPYSIAMARLDTAKSIVIKAAPMLMSDKYKFDGDEIHGPRRPTPCNYSTTHTIGGD